MLNKPQLEIDGYMNESGASGVRNPLAGFNILAAIRRQLWVVAVSIAVMLVIGFLYLSQAIPGYTSSVRILIDAKKVGMTASTPLEGSLTFEAGAVDSQAEILTSDKLANSVATSLGLQNNMAFLKPEGSLIRQSIGNVTDFVGSGLDWITQAPPSPEIEELPESLRLILATQTLKGNLKVSRVGRTYVFVINYSHTDPMLAQAIVGQYANAYLEDQLDSKFDSTRRASNWMEERIRDLRARSMAAAEAVQKYRADNNLIAASGRLIDEQSLTDSNTQLTAARSVLDTASARYQRLKEIVDSQDVTGNLTDSLESPNVAQLRSRYLAASKLESEISARYGPNHLAAERARKDMAEYTRLIAGELTNLLPTYRSDVAIAQARVTSIQNTINELLQANAVNDGAMVKLRGLEQEALSLNTLYVTFLQKFQEMQQQQSFPITDARIISEASVPLVPSSPRKFIIIFASLVLGGMIGAAIGLLREWLDRGFRTASQIRDELGLEFIANVPIIKASSPRKIIKPLIDNGGQKLAGPSTFITLTDNPILQKVVNEPASQYTEAIRALKFKMNSEFPKSKGIVIGIISMFPDEGKSTIAKNLASSLALQNTKTLLVDGDLRNPSLTNNLVGLPKKGLVDVVQKGVTIESVVAVEEASGMTFLPGVARAQQLNDFFGSSYSHELINSLRQQYEVVIIDFSPVGALTDALAAATSIDGYFFITQWGRTPRSILKEFMLNNPRIANKILGVVLNKVDMKRLDNYGSHVLAHQYGRYGGKYFANEAG